jgi:myo-inositol-1(or 4)-monophosphatase
MIQCSSLRLATEGWAAGPKVMRIMSASASSHLSIAKEAVAEATRIVLRAHRLQEFEASRKSDNSYVTRADLASEQAIVEVLRRATPNFGIYAEEGSRTRTDREYAWIVDPLDGTHNFHHGLPTFAIQVALEHQGHILVAVISLPLEGLVLHASRGCGCYANDAPVRVSSRRLEDSLLLLETSWDSLDLRLLSACAPAVHDIRVLGSACTSMANVALGRADFVIDRVDQPWDLAAGSLLIEEAGGKVTNLRGGPFAVYAPECLASNGHDHEQMLHVVGGVIRELDRS